MSKYELCDELPEEYCPFCWEPLEVCTCSEGMELKYQILCQAEEETDIPL